MIRAFVINLDRDRERMAFMAGQLDALGIPYERYPAVAPSEVLSSEYDEGRAFSQGGHVLLAGELGCAASHKRIYEEILARGFEHTLVLEDDVQLPDEFAAIIEKEARRNDNRWDYLLFDYWQPGLPFIRRWVRSVRERVRARRAESLLAAGLTLAYCILKACYVIPLSLLEGIRNSIKKLAPGPVTFYRPLYLAGAYLVTQRGARALLSLATPIVYTADKLPNQARVRAGLRFRAYAPLSVRQQKEVFGSSILEVAGPNL